MTARKIGLISLLAIFLMPAVLALDFSVNCPAEIQPGIAFNCDVSVLNPSATGLKGLSFTVDAGSAVVNSVTIKEGTDIGLRPTYGTLIIGSPIIESKIVAQVSLTAQSGFSLRVNGVKATLGDNTELISSQLNFPAVDLRMRVPCVPDCAGKQCGNDGCGGSCGVCPLNTICENNVCAARRISPQIDSASLPPIQSALPPPGTGVPTQPRLPSCISDCTGKQCGDNGCGGSCGTCAAGISCLNGICYSKLDAFSEKVKAILSGGSYKGTSYTNVNGSPYSQLQKITAIASALKCYFDDTCSI